jgi:hypothetical protein
MELKTNGSIHDLVRKYALAMFCLTLPFSLLLNNIAVFILALNWLAEREFKSKLQRLMSGRSAWYPMQLYLLVVVGLLFTQNYKEAGFELEKKLMLFFLPLFFVSSKPLSENDRRFVFKSFLISAFVSSLVCIVYATYRNYMEGHTVSYVYNALVNDIHLPGRYYYFNYWYFTYELFAQPLGMHPIYLSMYLITAGFLTVHLYWKQEQPFWKRAALSSIILYLFLIIVLLASRTQIAIAALSGTIFILHIAVKNGYLMRGLLFLAVMAVGGLFIILKNPVIRERLIDSNKLNAHYSENKYGEGGLSLRTYKWRYTLEAIKDSPWVGTGTGDAQDVLQTYYKKNDFTIGFENRFNAHNQYLQVFLEFGILGLISLCIGWLMPAVTAFRQKEWLGFAFMVLILLSCMTESMMEVNKGIAFYAFFYSLIFIRPTSEKI